MAAIFQRVPMPRADQAVVEPGSGIARRVWINYWGYVTRMAEALAKTAGISQGQVDFLATMTVLAASSPVETEWPEVTAADIAAPLVDADVVTLCNETKARLNETAALLADLQAQVNALGARFDRVVKSQETP
jgi:hypothetical protein